MVDYYFNLKIDFRCDLRPDEKKKKKLKKEGKVKLSFAMDEEEEGSIDSRSSSRGPTGIKSNIDLINEEDAEGMFF